MEMILDKNFETKFINEFSKEIYEMTYEFNKEGINNTILRVAKDLAKVEKDPEYWTQKFVWAMSEFKFIPGGRILSNAGTNLKGVTYINCFVDGFLGKDQDSIEGIMDSLKRQALILKSEGGYGFCVDVLRPRGSFISGIGNETPGAVKMLEMWDTQANVITAGSNKMIERKNRKYKIRKGAQMVTMSCWHPDILEFITAKQTPGYLTKFNMSVLITDEFMHAVENNLPWNLEFPDYESVPEIYQNEWDGNLKLWKSKGYPTKIYKTFNNANELWDIIMKSTYNRNEPGVLFIDTINRLNNLYYCEYISATNPCLTGDTLIKTDNGDITLLELVNRYQQGESFKVYSYNIDTQTIEIKDVLFALRTRIAANIMKIILNDGTILRLTPEHRVYTKNRGYIYAFELNSNDILVKIDDNNNPQEISISNLEPDNIEDVYDITVLDNNNFFANGILVHNCGEQPLPIGGVCLLGSINLTQFIDFENKDWDYKKLKTLIPIVVRMMDNVNDITYVPLDIQKENLKNKRRIGLGIMGYGSALMMMQIRYGSDYALKITEKLQKFIMNEAYRASALLAKEKGPFPLFDKEKYLNSNFIKNLDPDVIELIKKYGIRNSHLLSHQPTGNTAILANVVSGGQEPVFLPVYIRTSVVQYPPEGLDLPKNIDWINKKFDSNSNWEWIKEGDEYLLAIEFNGYKYKYDKSRGLVKETVIKDYAVNFLEEKNLWDPNADWAATVFQLSIDDHIKTMSIFAKYIDSGMSKTINIPNDYSYEDFKRVYFDLYKSGFVKGCTTYRMGTMMEVLSSTDKDKNNNNNINKIQKTTAPKRPKSLNCEIHHIIANGIKWIVIVGLLDNEPYEVFAFKPKAIHLSSKIKNGILTKIKSGYYNLECDNIIIENICEYFETAEQEALTRLISTALRHGADIEFIVDQLLKSKDSITSFSKAIARTLKKYIKTQKLKKICKSCGSENIVLQEGCYICMNCSNSKCS